ncbi:hypothetical protein BKP45_10625 [Anaerobacillus alkalidiazotrophicus]|uniref:Uncharacterized protein n=1 Tax=Anaerobacillus alkalidiazotrophicus TaxID=472963 RepID=A0A1S2M035_9BACI|nr:hypothetical protein [Anaerobacillus alkalidiazotrophicus]OIJ18048.1 hypothetical protein BKP45_16340 [Anaerobacillus alkalidiazotrophicus]OIJ19527.1 hypothetical protein BKP45_10625 [Anaerobacillus alkalidiazotrophicus]
MNMKTKEILEYKKNIESKIEKKYKSLSKMLNIEIKQRIDGRYLLLPYAINEIFEVTDEQLTILEEIAGLFLDHISSIDMVIDRESNDMTFLSVKYFLIYEIINSFRKLNLSQSFFEELVQDAAEYIFSINRVNFPIGSDSLYERVARGKLKMVNCIIRAMNELTSNITSYSLFEISQYFSNICLLEQLFDDLRDIDEDLKSKQYNYFNSQTDDRDNIAYKLCEKIISLSEVINKNSSSEFELLNKIFLDDNLIKVKTIRDKIEEKKVMI